MKLSERSIKRLGEIITGDKQVSPYRSGPQLVSFFNEFGTNHTYGQGFPSRWMFAESCIRQFNDTPTLKKIIVSALDPRDFMGTMVFDAKTQERKPANLQEALTYLNEFLAFDGYEIVPPFLVAFLRGSLTLMSNIDDVLPVLCPVFCLAAVSRSAVLVHARRSRPSERPSRHVVRDSNAADRPLGMGRTGGPACRSPRIDRRCLSGRDPAPRQSPGWPTSCPSTRHPLRASAARRRTGSRGHGRGAGGSAARLPRFSRAAPANH